MSREGELPKKTIGLRERLIKKKTGNKEKRENEENKKGDNGVEKKEGMPDCDVCMSIPAEESITNKNQPQTCQFCGNNLCEDCTIFGNDLLPRCDNPSDPHMLNSCHDSHLKDCEECAGSDSSNCNECHF